MKKFFLFTVLAVTAVLIAAGCAKDSGASPAASGGASATPVVLVSGDVLDTFEDQDLSASISTVTGTWSAGNDSADGGTSSVSTFAVNSNRASQGTYSAELTGTINSSISFPGSANYTSLVAITSPTPTPAYTKIGYLTATLTLNAPVSLIGATSIRFSTYLGSSAGIYFKVFLYDQSNRSISTSWASPIAAWANWSFTSANFSVPGGASYTADDIIRSVTKLVLVISRRSTTADGAALIFNIDNVYLQ